MPTPIAHPRDADLIILEQSLFCLFVCLKQLPTCCNGQTGLKSLIQRSGSQLEVIFLSPRGHVPISGNVFVCHNRKLGATDTWWAEARDAAKYPVVHRTAPQSEEVPGLKCQSCVFDRGHTEDWFKRRSVAGWLSCTKRFSYVSGSTCSPELCHSPIKTWSLFYSSVHEI